MNKSIIEVKLIITDTFEPKDNERFYTDDEVKQGLIEVLKENVSEEGTVDILEFNLNMEEEEENS